MLQEGVNRNNKGVEPERLDRRGQKKKNRLRGTSKVNEALPSGYHAPRDV